MDCFEIHLEFLRFAMVTPAWCLGKNWTLQRTKGQDDTLPCVQGGYSVGCRAVSNTS